MDANVTRGVGYYSFLVMHVK